MASKLTASRIETAKTGKYSDGGNLYLIVSETLLKSLSRRLPCQ